MKCSLCGFRFDETDANVSCAGCALARGCDLVKCPNCGFEMPRPPAWMEKILKRRNERNGIDGKS